MPRQTVTQIQEMEMAAMRSRRISFAQIATTYQLPMSTVRHAVRRGQIRMGVAVAPTRRTTPRTMATISQFDGFTVNERFTFGVEIEVVGISVVEAQTALNNINIACQNQGYTHTVMATWKVVPDASLSSRNGRSCEVVSPVLRGKDGLKEIANVMLALKNAGATINTSTGCHVHIGMDGIVSREVQALVLVQHARWQMAFNTLVTEHRLNNSFCRQRSEYAAQQLANEWLRGRTSGYSDRYYTLNVCSFARYGTFEFRQHHGCTNGRKIAAWIALHIAFIEQVEREYLNPQTDEPRLSEVDDMTRRSLAENTDAGLRGNQMGRRLFDRMMASLTHNMDANAVEVLNRRSCNIGARSDNGNI